MLLTPRRMTTPNVQTTTSKPDRRRFQYTLAGLLGFTTFVAVVLSLLRWIYVKYGLDIVGLVVLVAISGSFHLGCALWAFSDARKRGSFGIFVVALFAYAGPFGLIPWLLLRPPIKKFIRSAAKCRGPDAALAAALKLDMAGDWDAAVALYGEVTKRWPEHEPYARGRLAEIKEKQSRME